jgi:hypothetical protein
VNWLGSFDLVRTGPSGRDDVDRLAVRRLTAILGFAIFILACSVNVSVGDYYGPDPGQILFGRALDMSNTMVSDPATTMAQDGDMAFVGLFERHVTGTVHMEVVKDSEPARGAGSFTFTAPGNFWSGKWHLSDFPGPGHCQIRMVLDSEVLAEGTLDLTAG